MQGYKLEMPAQYISENDFADEGNGFGTWYIPGDSVEHYGSYASFVSEKNYYNTHASEYNDAVDKENEPRTATKEQVSLGVEFTNDKNTITGGVKGIYAHYSGFGENKVSGNNIAAEAYGSVDVGHGIKINGSINTNKVATVGVSITGLLD